MNGHTVYGAQGVASATNYPGIRYEAAEWKDVNGKFWIYAGYETTTPYDHADMWKYDPATNMWTWMSGSNVSGTVPSWGTKGIPSTSNLPGVRRLAPASWTDHNGKFWMFGGGNTAGSYFYNDMWKYDPVTNQWTWMNGTNTTNATGVYGTKGVFAPANTPGGKVETDCAVTDSHGKLWLFGGQGIDSTGFVWRHSNELWAFDPSTNQWAFMGGNKLGDQKGVYGTMGTAAATNWPGCRQIHLGWIDSKDQIWFWGGRGYDATGAINPLNDMWMYSTTTGLWTWMSGTNASVTNPSGNYGTQCVPAASNIPCQRIEARAHWTDNCDNLWMLGGSFYDGIIGQEDRNDLWRYNTKTNLWTWVSGDNTTNTTGVYGTKGVASTANKPESMEGANAFYVLGDGLWLCGGANWHDHGVGLFHSPSFYNHFEVWKYVPDKPSAAFSFTAGAGCGSQKVTFTDNSIPNCNEIKSRLWNFGDPSSGTADTSTLPNPVHTYGTAGTYQVKLIVYNCTLGKDSITKPVIVAAGSGQTVTLAAQTNPACNGSTNGNGNATVTVSGGTAPYTYSWSPAGGTSATATGLGGGTFTCTVTDGGGCIQTQTVTLTAPSAISASASATNATCGNNNGTASTAASGGTGTLSYSWTPSGGNSATATTLAAGTYTCTVTDANGCNKTITVAVNNTGGPTVSLNTQTNPTCNASTNGNATVSVSGGSAPYTYSWSPAGGTSATATGLGGGTFTCTVKDGGGCIQTQTVTLTAPAAISASASATNTACGNNSGTATVTASGGTGTLNYSWAPSGGNAATATALAAGTYTCTITDANGCSKTTTAAVNNTGGPAVSLSTQTNPTCNGSTNGNATVTVSGGTAPYTYSWSPAGGTGSTANGLSGGTFTCTVTDAGGCIQTQTVSLTAPSSITITTAFTPSNCGSSNGTATASASGGTGAFSYSWSPSGGTAATATSLAAGTYTCTVTDAHGCSNTNTVAVTSTGGPAVTLASQNNPLCNGAATGSATVNASGGTSPYTYSWSPAGGSGATAANLVAGTYTCMVTDAGGCTQSQTLTLTNPADITETISSVPVCGLHNGSASATANGGTGTLTYSWTPSGGNTANASSLTSGVYTCLVTDANGCTATTTATVKADSIPVAFAGTDTTIGIGSVTILNANGGGTYLWSPASTLSCSTCTHPVATPLATTEYCVRVTNSGGCVDSSCVIITVDATCGEVYVPNYFSPNADGVNDYLCVYGQCIQTMTISIYDRWGECVFTSTSPSQCWDGTFHGQLMNTAVFVYYLQATLLNGQVVTQKGDISLVR